MGFTGHSIELHQALSIEISSVGKSVIRRCLLRFHNQTSYCPHAKRIIPGHFSNNFSPPWGGIRKGESKWGLRGAKNSHHSTSFSKCDLSNAEFIFDDEHGVFETIDSKIKLVIDLPFDYV